MRKQLLFSGALVALMTLPAHSQPVGQPAGNQGSPPVQGLPPGPQQQPQLAPAQRGPLPPGLSRGVQTPLAMNTNLLNNTNQLGMGSNPIGIGSNQFTISTNELGIGSNELGFREWATNQFSRLSNGLLVTPTGREGTPRVTLQDRAFTVADQALLIRLRQVVQPTAPTTEPLAPNVHFMAREGVVTLVGFVPTQEERDRVENLVRQTPGVVQVIDQLQVTASTGATVNGQEQSGVASVEGGTNLLGMSATNQGTFDVSTNLMPTGRSNGLPRIYRTAPLPPELQNRQQPPR